MLTVPLAGELAASLISRVAARYGLAAGNVLRLWTCRNFPARHDGGGVRADAEVVLNDAGRRVLAELCRPAVRTAVPGEATASYLTRLAAAYRLSPAQLLDGPGTTVTGTEHAPPAAEIRLSAEAARRLSGFARTPITHLIRALPHLPPPAPSLANTGAHGTATAHWHVVEPALQPLPACTACTIGRSPHTAASAWIHPSPGLPRIMICTRHQQASSDPQHPAPLDIRAVPELTQAHLSARRPATPTSLSWASTITTRWYDPNSMYTKAGTHAWTGLPPPTPACRQARPLP